MGELVRNLLMIVATVLLAGFVIWFFVPQALVENPAEAPPVRPSGGRLSDHWRELLPQLILPAALLIESYVIYTQIDDDPSSPYHYFWVLLEFAPIIPLIFVGVNAYKLAQQSQD
jgi:hypothetical protein